MLRIRTKIGTVGWVEYDGGAEMAVVGDRVLPVEAKAVFPSDATSPALELRLAVVDDVPQCREIRITSKEGGREVRTSDLRAVQLERWIEDLFASVAARVEHVDADAGIVSAVDEHDEKRVAEAARVVQRARAAARRSITPEMLEGVAQIYRKHVDGQPTDAVRRAFGVEYRTAAKYVQRARAAGLLPATTPGKRKA